ncbi:enoyl-CoA hydratase/isomerase family protein [Dechloromonas sp. ARDL1]|uniref:enoyl-CoA hydratase/isomerase family protein n=1 Tax=Dechloromonas sp. ARDL1 TaxID=3322121 RepID=UPI003DA6FA55
MRASHSVLFDIRESIALLTINRPEAMNALDPGVLSCLARQLDRVKADPRIAAVIVTGAGGKAFSSGADIKYLSAATPSAIHAFSRQAGALANRIETLGKIVVAAINGHAYGNGLELALSCALRVAGRSSRFGHPDIRHGVVAGSVGISRLARLVGRGRATELLLCGHILLAEEACQIGLINAVVDDDRLIAEAEAMTRDILALSPAALRYTWEACCRGFDLPPAESAELGADLLGRCATTEDFRIGTQAFVDKTKPVFVGH